MRERERKERKKEGKKDRVRDQVCLFLTVIVQDHSKHFQDEMVKKKQKVCSTEIFCSLATFHQNGNTNLTTTFIIGNWTIYQNVIKLVITNPNSSFVFRK